MKKFGMLLLMALLLVGCTPKAYTENIDKGIEQLEEGNFTKAVTYFETAKEEKNTEAVKELLKIATLLKDSTDALAEGKYEEAIEKAEKVVNYKIKEKDNNEVIGTAKKRANELLNQANTELVLKSEVNKKIAEGKKLLDQQKFDDAYALFNEIATATNYPDTQVFHDFISEATNLSKDVLNKKEEYDLEQQKKKEENNQQKGEGQTSVLDEQPNTSFTITDAEKLVRKQLDLTNDSTVYVEFDHRDEKGNYIIHVYQVVVNDGDDYGHTVTYGWYSVNPKTKSVQEAF